MIKVPPRLDPLPRRFTITPYGTAWKHEEDCYTKVDLPLYVFQRANQLAAAKGVFLKPFEVFAAETNNSAFGYREYHLEWANPSPNYL